VNATGWQNSFVKRGVSPDGTGTDGTVGLVGTLTHSHSGIASQDLASWIGEQRLSKLVVVTPAVVVVYLSAAVVATPAAVVVTPAAVVENLSAVGLSLVSTFGLVASKA